MAGVVAAPGAGRVESLLLTVLPVTACSGGKGIDGKGVVDAALAGSGDADGAGDGGVGDGECRNGDMALLTTKLRVATLFKDFKYSDGLIRFSLADGDGNFGGMKGRAICLFIMVCILDGLDDSCVQLSSLLLPFCCNERNDSAISASDPAMSAGNDNGRFNLA